MTEPVQTQAELSELARQRVMAARVIAQDRWPYMSSLLFNLRLVEVRSHTLPTMAVDDGLRLYYNPNFVLDLDVEETVTVIMHECLHCIYKHSARLDELVSTGAISDFSENRSLYRFLWNVAADCNVNQTLDELQVTWPSNYPPLRYQNYAEYGIEIGDITESMFLRLVETLDWNQDELENSGERCDCGSIADRQARPYELPQDDDVAPAMSKSEQDLVRDRLALDISRNIGNTAGTLERWAREQLDPKVNWRRELAARIRASVATIAGRRDYSFMRPSRRQDALRSQGSSVILPAMRQPAPPRLAIILDTSGSISAHELDQFLSEIHAMVRAVGISQGVWVIPTDAVARTPIRLRSGSTVRNLNIQGGGGTDMRTGIYAALQLKPNVNIIIVLTDGFTPWPDDKPSGCEHYIVALTHPGGLEYVPNWMHTIPIYEMESPAQTRH